MGVSTRTTQGLSTLPSAEFVGRLRDGLRGPLITPEAPTYDVARTVWNAMIDRRPGLIVRPAGAADVLHAVRFATEHRLTVAVRGGGHNIAGSAVCEGGLVIDFSGMRSVRVDPVRRTARVEPGATLAEFDREAQAFGLATPLGINSTTGVAGLTLGGGFGWLSRAYGLTVDNLLSADVVTADGRLLQASEATNGDLFWGLRGGGGNFGVVTSFEYQLHPVGPEVLAGLIVHPFDDAAGLIRQYRDAVQHAPDALTAWIVLRKAPPLPFLDASVHGREVVVIALCYAGSVADGERAVRPLREIGRPHADVVSPMPFVNWQAAFDPLLTPGARNYWKTHDFRTLDDALIDTLVEHASHLPDPQCEIFVGNLGGAVSRRPESATAYTGRDAQFVMNVHGRWNDRADDEKVIAWARGVFHATTPFATGNAYVNFLTSEEQERVPAAYGANYERLAALKRRYDPDNLFHVNQNIRPA